MSDDWAITTALLVLLVLAGVGLIVFGIWASGGPNPYNEPDTLITSDGTLRVVDLNWVPTNPPREGLNCWMAIWSEHTVNYCEEKR